MERYKVIVAYDGTQFAGFQRLNSGGKAAIERTVQGEIESALEKLGWIGSSILAAGRTDTGVHADGQVVAFDLEWRHSPGELCQAMNANLPSDVAARSVEVVTPDFHPRYAACWRRYCYQIFCQPCRDPLRERYAWRVWPAVDEQLLEAAASLFDGEHDFAAFGTPPRRGGSTRRKVRRARWMAWNDSSGRPEMDCNGLRFEIVANAFLYHMVRRLVFVQVQVGQGRFELSELTSALEDRALRLKGLAPAQGLRLVEVRYQDE